ncbi:MAG: hypothetical protein ACLUIU_02005 [Lachnospiraceae bacterium]|jgi:hypothetical protein
MKSDVCILHEIKNSLQEKKQTILQLLDDMNYRINEVWSKQEREYIDACFAYERYLAELKIKPDRKETLIRIEDEATKYVRVLLGEDEKKTLDEMMKIVYARADANLKQIKQFKEELLRAMKPYAYHVNSISGLSELKASVQKENMYCNEVVDGVFSVSDYDQLILYIGRAVAGGMHVMKNGSICIYSRNPVQSVEEEIVVLKKDVYLYRVSLDEFEPVIDYVLNNGRAEIFFGHEWISRKNKVSCDGISLRAVSINDWTKHQFYYNTGVVDETTLGETYLKKMDANCLNEVLRSLVLSGKIVRI